MDNEAVFRTWQLKQAIKSIRDASRNLDLAGGAVPREVSYEIDMVLLPKLLESLARREAEQTVQHDTH